MLDEINTVVTKKVQKGVMSASNASMARADMTRRVASGKKPQRTATKKHSLVGRTMMGKR